MTTALVVRDTPDPAKWEATAATWLAKRRSERTRRAYHDALGLLVAFAGVPAWDITPAHVAGWVDAMRADKSSDATIALRLAAVGTFYATAVDDRLLDVSPVEGIERPRVEPYGKAEALKRDQVARVLASIDRTSPAGRRDYCMMLMSVTMALRRAEVVSIRRGDIRAALEADADGDVAEATAGSRRLIAILCPEPYSSDLSRSSLHHLEERCKTTL